MVAQIVLHIVTMDVLHALVRVRGNAVVDVLQHVREAAKELAQLHVV